MYYGILKEIMPKGGWFVKIFMSVDIEGVSGAVAREQTLETGAAEFAALRKSMTAEAAAAARGAIAEGADEIVAADAHGLCRNLIHEDLPREVRLVQGELRPLGMMEGIISAHKAAFFIGYHAKRNTFDGTLNHSMSGKRISAIYVNGVEFGEIALNAALAAEFAVPVTLVTGDEATCAEAEKFIPGVITAATKRGIGMIAAESLHPETACEHIEEAARKAMRSAGKIKPMKVKGPVVIEVEFVRSGMADAAVFCPGSKRLSPSRVSYKARNYSEAFRAFHALLMLSASFPF
jgi:D-amino peptidase